MLRGIRRAHADLLEVADKLQYKAEHGDERAAALWAKVIEILGEIGYIELDFSLDHFAENLEQDEPDGRCEFRDPLD